MVQHQRHFKVPTRVGVEYCPFYEQMKQSIVAINIMATVSVLKYWHGFEMPEYTGLFFKAYHFVGRKITCSK